MPFKPFQAGMSAIAVMMALGAAHVAVAVEPSLAGVSLENAIDVLSGRGLRVFYSSDLVRPGMRVDAEPESEDPEAVLAEILAPVGLAARPGPRGSWLVVRAPRPESLVPARIAQPAPASRGSPRPRPLEELVVTASQYELSRALTPSQSLLDTRDLEYLPDLGDDSIRAIARLPGTASNGFSALASIRGGALDETLIRLDGLRLYDPFHLKDFQGPFSVIDPRIVDSMEIYTGGFPAYFGDRMSGVIDVETLPARDGLYHELGVSFFTSSFLSSGSFHDDRGHWTASLRRSNIDFLYGRFSELPERPLYTDVFAKLAFEVSSHLTVRASFLRAEDDLSFSDDIDREERAEARYLDRYVWVDLAHTLGNRTSGRTLVSHTSLDGERAGTSEKSGVSAGWLSDTRSFAIDAIRTEWSRLVGDRIMLGFGATVESSRGRYDYSEDVELDLLFDVEGAPTAAQRTRSMRAEPSSHQYALFATVQYDWTDRLATEAGIRWNRQELDAVDHSTSGPRLGIRYALSQSTALRVSWGRFYQSQAINELPVSDGVLSFDEPQRADHLVVGVEHAFASGTRMRLEAYDKAMSRLRPRFENLLNTRVLLPELKPDRIRLAPSTARARGIELGFEGRTGPLSWWTNYTWSRVRDRIGDREVLRSWDQTHSLGGGISWDTAQWNVSLGLTYRSGWPTTRRMSLDDTGAIPIARVVDRNTERLSPYRSFDFRLTRKIELEASSLLLSFEASNLFDSSNPCCIEYEIGDEEDLGLLVLDELNHLPVVPSLGVLWKF